MSSLLRRAANGIGNFPKNSNLQGCNIAKTGASAILQCSFSGSDNVKFRRGAGRPFQRTALLGSCSQTTGQRPCLACRLGRCFCRLKPAEVATGDPHPLGERKTCLQVAFLIGSPVKSAFALLLTRVTEPRLTPDKERM